MPVAVSPRDSRCYIPISLDTYVFAATVTYLVHRVDYPVDPWVATNCFVLWVNEDDLEVFVGGILVDPVGIEDSKVGTATTNTLFGGRFQRALIFELIDTLVGRLAYEVDQLYIPHLKTLMPTVGCTLWHRPLTATTPDPNTVDDISLLCLVT